MKVTEVLSKSMEIVSKNPSILVPYLVPASLNLINGLATFKNIDGFQIYWPTLRPTPLEEFVGYSLEMLLIFIRIAGMKTILDISSAFFTVIATAMAILITLNSLKGRKYTLSGTLIMVSDKLIILYIAMIVRGILTVLGLCAFIIGAIILTVLLTFVPQGIVADGLSLSESFSRSYKIAKSNFFDVFLVILFFSVVGIVTMISMVVIQVQFLGNALKPFVSAFSTISLTILYLDIERRDQDRIEMKKKEIIIFELLKDFETTENLRQELQAYFNREIPDLAKVSLKELKEFQEREKNR